MKKILKPIYNFDVEQGSDEWHEKKLGWFSASKAADLLMDKSAKGYKNLIRQITEERITGRRCENRFAGNTFTDRGLELEADAINDYELREFNKVDLVGYVRLDDWTLCSPDGLIGEDGLIQVKCPIFSTQWDYLEAQKVPTNYYKQMQFEMYVTGRSWNIFYSYHPNLKPVMIKVERDEDMINQIAQRIKEAAKEVKENIKKLKK